MKSSFFKNLGPIRYSAIKEHFESIPINIDEDTPFNEFTSIKNLKERGLSFLTDKHFSKENILIIYKNILNEGLIGIIASRLKDYFNKPSIVITKSNDKLKASARSTLSYNIGYLIKSLVDNNIIDSGGGHNMAAGFTMKKNNLKLLDSFIQKDFKKKNLTMIIQIIMT